MPSQRSIWLASLLLLGSAKSFAPFEQIKPPSPPDQASTTPSFHVPVGKVQRKNCGDVYAQLIEPLSDAGEPYALRRCTAFRYESDMRQHGADAFVVGGVNSSDRLRRISTITGVSFETLEARMVGTGDIKTGGGTMAWLFREGMTGVWEGVTNPLARKSGPGLLTKDRKLREVLIADNDAVLVRRLTHQHVAKPLLQILDRVEQMESVGPNGVSHTSLEIAGENYRIEARPMNAYNQLISGWTGNGTQGSGFDDQVFATYYVVVTRSDGKQLQIDALTPHLIHRYGFYQDGPFRVPPPAIIDFFKIQPGR